LRDPCEARVQCGNYRDNRANSGGIGHDESHFQQGTHRPHASGRQPSLFTSQATNVVRSELPTGFRIYAIDVGAGQAGFYGVMKERDRPLITNGCGSPQTVGRSAARSPTTTHQCDQGFDRASSSTATVSGRPGTRKYQYQGAIDSRSRF
jgi:hypothetical protein